MTQREIAVIAKIMRDRGEAKRATSPAEVKPGLIEDQIEWAEAL